MWRLGLIPMLVAWSVLATTCAGRRAPTVAPIPPAERYVPTYVLSRFGLASGCPVGPRRILTARHAVVAKGSVVDTLDRIVWGQPALGVGSAGYARVVSVDAVRDLAILEPDEDVPVWYEMATDPPEPGDTVWLAGYDFQHGLQPLVIETAVTRLLPGHVVIGNPGSPGFSGSCILGQAGVVAVLHWSMTPDPDRKPGQHLGVGSAIWGPWRP
jgi:hypothetical protein